MSSIVYIACPYMSDKQSVINHRVRVATEYAARLSFLNVPAYSPLTYTSPLIQFPYYRIAEEFWYKHGLTMLHQCGFLHVLLLEDWTKSRGIRLELEAAKELNMPTHSIMCEDRTQQIEFSAYVSSAKDLLECMDE